MMTMKAFPHLAGALTTLCYRCYSGEQINRSEINKLSIPQHWRERFYRANVQAQQLENKTLGYFVDENMIDSNIASASDDAIETLAINNEPLCKILIANASCLTLEEVFESVFDGELKDWIRSYVG